MPSTLRLGNHPRTPTLHLRARPDLNRTVLTAGFLAFKHRSLLGVFAQVRGSPSDRVAIRRNGSAFVLVIHPHLAGLAGLVTTVESVLLGVLDVIEAHRKTVPLIRRAICDGAHQRRPEHRA